MRLLKVGHTGDDVREHQRHLNNRLRAHRDTLVVVDGEVGSETIAQTAYAAWFLGAMDETVKEVQEGEIAIGVQSMIAHPGRRTAAQRARAVDRRDEHFGTLQRRALRVAEGLVGVMEQGGNNQGPTVTKIIRANGGTGPEPWCGDFVAYCYRLAGSDGVDRRWASVAETATDADVHRVSDPQAGDIVRFNFSHMGLYVRHVNGGEIETIEGNTTAAGAVSDSKTGGDGVYRKRRNLSLVTDYLRVER